MLIITLVLYLIGPWGSGAETAEPSNKNPYSACAAGKTAAMSGGAAQAVQSEADRAAAFNAQSARTSMASKPVQYKSELARAIMQPPAYDQLEESKVQELSDKDH